MLHEGVCGTIEELAKQERVNRGYMSRALRLTLLAPDIVEAILDGRRPERMRLEDLLGGLPVEWTKQGERNGAAALAADPAARAGPSRRGFLR